MELYTDLPPSKTGSVLPDKKVHKPVAALRPAMAPALLIRRKVAGKAVTAVAPRQTALEVAVAAAHRADSSHAASGDPGDGCTAASEDDAEEPYGLFPEVEDEYDPWRPNSLENILREREEARLARQRQLELEEEEERESEERSSRQQEPSIAPATSDYGRGRGLNNLPAWMRGGGAANGSVTGASLMQDGSGFVGGGDNAGLGLASDTVGDGGLQGVAHGAQAVPLAASAPPAPATSVSRQAEPKSKALKMMAAWGYEVGKGLGKDGTGITSALEHVKTGARSGVIVSRGAPTAAASGAASTAAADALAARAGPSRVVLLYNMAPPGGVDDDLATEVQEECGERYGPVRQCFVFECAADLGIPSDEAVRTFVMFEDAASAERARAQLDGRFFGGRTIKASLYPEDRFLRFDLAPDLAA